MNCPFYGRSMFRTILESSVPFILIDQRGNQCALVLTAHSPCYMEINGEPVDWRECERVANIRSDQS